MPGLMDAIGLSGEKSSSAEEKSSPEASPGPQKGIAKRLGAAIESGNDARVSSILKDFVQECMDEYDSGDYEGE